MKVQQRVTLHDDEWRVLTATVIGSQNLCDCTQPEADRPTAH